MVIHFHSSTQLTTARGVTSASSVQLHGVHEDTKCQEKTPIINYFRLFRKGLLC